MQEQAQTGPDFDAREEYRTIEATLLSSSRGRWFLSEHGRRARRLDNALLEDAIGRLQNSIRQPPALLGQLQGEVESIRAQIDETRGELVARTSAKDAGAPAAGAISENTAQEAEAGDGESSSGDTKASGDWQPLEKMLEAAEEIHEQAWSLQAKDINPDACEAIARQASALYALSMHQATHSTRILKLADALGAMGERIEGILTTIAHEMQVDEIDEIATPSAIEAAVAGEPELETGVVADAEAVTEVEAAIEAPAEYEFEDET